jgi:hypothetical protein
VAPPLPTCALLLLVDVAVAVAVASASSSQLAAPGTARAMAATREER